MYLELSTERVSADITVGGVSEREHRRKFLRRGSPVGVAREPLIPVTMVLFAIASVLQAYSKRMQAYGDRDHTNTM